MITTTEANKTIARPKRLVVPMGWSKKLNHIEPAWFEYRSALEFEDDPTETPEGLQIICQWKRADGAKPENWTFSLLSGADRIYALDVQPLAFHTNRTGFGRPYFGKRLEGIHEHTWSEDGYGYAEPFVLRPVRGPEAWKEFLTRAGIADEPFVHPDKAINSGQQTLDL